jgi:hypothetical protein
MHYDNTKILCAFQLKVSHKRLRNELYTEVAILRKIPLSKKVRLFVLQVDNI